MTHHRIEPFTLPPEAVAERVRRAPTGPGLAVLLGKGERAIELANTEPGSLILSVLRQRAP